MGFGTAVRPATAPSGPQACSAHDRCTLEPAISSPQVRRPASGRSAPVACAGRRPAEFGHLQSLTNISELTVERQLYAKQRTVERRWPSVNDAGYH